MPESIKCTVSAGAVKESQDENNTTATWTPDPFNFMSVTPRMHTSGCSSILTAADSRAIENIPMEIDMINPTPVVPTLAATVSEAAVWHDLPEFFIPPTIVRVDEPNDMPTGESVLFDGSANMSYSAADKPDYLIDTPDLDLPIFAMDATNYVVNPLDSTTDIPVFPLAVASAESTGTIVVSQETSDMCSDIDLSELLQYMDANATTFDDVFNSYNNQF